MSDTNAEIVASSDENKEPDTEGSERASVNTVSGNVLLNERDQSSKDNVPENASLEKRASENQKKDVENEPQEETLEEQRTQSQDTLMRKLQNSKLSLVSEATVKTSNVVDSDQETKQDEGEIASARERASSVGSYSAMLDVNAEEADPEELALEDMFPDDAESGKLSAGQETPVTSLSIAPEVSIQARYTEASIDRNEFLTGLIPTPSIRSEISEKAPSSTSSSSDSPVASVDEEMTIDRKLYYQLHTMYSNKNRDEKRKNNYYQTRMADYYMRRRMYHVLYVDPKSTEDNQRRYGKLLEELEAIHERFTREQEDGESEVGNLKNKWRFRRTELDTLFENFQKQEYEVAKEAISSKDDAAKEIATKFIDRYLKRQKHGLAFLSKIRLDYVKLHNRVDETQELLDSLDNLGPGLRVMNYQQLKNDNRTLSDKLEEKEMNLDDLRRRCQNCMQILAHTREKVFAMNKDIGIFYEHLEETTSDCTDVREQIVQLKADRDELRREIQKFKDQIGLLGKPKLLRHMQESIDEVEATKKQVNDYMSAVDNITEEIRLLKRKSSTILAKQSMSQDSLAV